MRVITLLGFIMLFGGSLNVMGYEDFLPSPVVEEQSELLDTVGVPTVSSYRGYWTGKFDAPVPEELIFLFNFKTNGTWTAYITNLINMSTNVKMGTFTIDASGLLMARNTSGNPAFSAFHTGRNKLDMVMVNTGGPGILGVAYKGVQSHR